MHTDATALALVVAEHVACRASEGASEGGADKLDEDDLVRSFVRVWQAEPWRGYGVGTPRLFGLLHAGVPWADAARAFAGVSDANGNGAAVRVAAVALAASSAEHAADLARRTAQVTHARPNGQLGAVARAVAVYLALQKESSSPLNVDRFVHDIARTLPTQAWRDKLDQVLTLLGRANPERAGQILGRDTSALSSVPTALLAFLTHIDAPVEAVRFAVRVGGGTSAIPAMPQNWVRRLPIAHRLLSAANRFG